MTAAGAPDPKFNGEFTVAVVVGTNRPGNFTSKAARLVREELAAAGVKVDYIDPAEMDLAFPGTRAENPDGDDLRERISAATAVVLATPEYHGSMASMMKLIIENLGFPSVLAGKPIALLGVAAGTIGAIKSLEQLRSVCSHVGAIVLPGPVSVANVKRMFDSEGNPTDPAVEQRVRGVATGLLEYINRNICPMMTLERQVRGAD